MAKDDDKRSYTSPLREEQARQTRQLIVDALVEQVAQSGRTDFAMNEVAERAGVSVRTVYRHFPTREDLLAAVNAAFHANMTVELPKSATDILEHNDALFRWFAQNRDMVVASHLTGLGREVRKHGRSKRNDMARSVMGKWLEALDEREQRLAFAVMRTMFGSFTWMTMVEELGLSTEEAAEATSWVLGLVIDDIERRIAAKAKAEAPAKSKKKGAGS